MSSDTDIRYLLDRLEIQDVIARYALGQNVTQHDDILLDLWREVFTPDARLDYGAGGFGKGTYVELADWMRGDGPNGRMYEFTRWQHLLGLPTVTIDGDAATARTDMLVSHKAKPDDSAEQDSSWYVTSAFALHDNLVRTADGWRISFRHLEVLQAAPQEPGPAHTATPTTRKPSSRCAEPSQNVPISHVCAHQARSEFPGEAMELIPVSPTAKAPGQEFTGDVYVNPIHRGEDPSRIIVGLVRFTPGARTNWHSHDLGQTLHVTDGIGLVVTRDGTVIRMRAGDTVHTPPGEDHWHGATDGNFMSHLALLEGAGHDNGTTWLEPVTDDQYRAANHQ